MTLSAVLARSLALAAILLSTLPCHVAAHSEAIDLNQWRWQQRLLIGWVTDKDDVAQLQTYSREYASDITERKLRIMLLHKDNWYIDQGPSLTSAGKQWLAQRHDQLLLIGLDGYLKDQFPVDNFDLQRVFNRIDGMPMRKAELESK